MLASIRSQNKAVHTGNNLLVSCSLSNWTITTRAPADRNEDVCSEFVSTPTRSSSVMTGASSVLPDTPELDVSFDSYELGFWSDVGVRTFHSWKGGVPGKAMPLYRQCLYIPIMRFGFSLFICRFLLFSRQVPVCILQRCLASLLLVISARARFCCKGGHSALQVQHNELYQNEDPNH